MMRAFIPTMSKKTRTLQIIYKKHHNQKGRVIDLAYNRDKMSFECYSNNGAM